MTDNLSVGVVTARYLNKHGFGVSTAPDLKSAVTKFAASPVDIIILDDFENGEGSLKILKVLRELEDGGASVPVLMAGSITWASSVEDEAKSLGVTKFLFEPFADMPRLLETVSETLMRGDHPSLEKPAEELLDELLGDFDTEEGGDAEEIEVEEVGEAHSNSQGVGEHLIGDASSHFEVKAPFRAIGHIRTAVHDTASVLGSPEQEPTVPPVSEPRAEPVPTPEPAMSDEARRVSSTRPDETGEQGSAEIGSLASRDIAELFASLYLERASGLLLVRQEAVEKAIYLEKGSPVNVESCLPTESFGAYLERMGRLSNEQLKTIERERCGEGHREVELLLARGWLNPNEIFASITEHVTETAISCFAWHDGDYKFSRGAGPGAGNIPLRLDTARLVLDGIKRHYNLARLNKRLSITNETLLLIKEGGEVRPSELKLTTAEARLFERVKHGATFGELLMQGNEKGVEVLALLYGFRVLGLLLRDDSQQGPRPAATPSPGRFVHVSSPPPRRNSQTPRRGTPSSLPRARTAASTPSPTAKEVTEPPSPEDELLQELNALKDADYFTLLGLSRDADLNEVHHAFRRRVKRFHQDKLSTYTPEIQGKGKKVYLRLMEGYKVLTDPEQREQYLTELEENEPIPAEAEIPAQTPSPRPEPRDIEASEASAEKAQSTPPSPDQSSPPSSPDVRTSKAPESPVAKEMDLDERLNRLIERIQEFLVAEKFTAAVTTLQNSLSEPYEKVRIHAWLGWALYNKSPEKFMGEAESQLAEARRADPNHPEPYLFMARIREAEDSADQAHTFYKKAADVAPRDRQIVKELKEFEKRLKKGSLKVRAKQKPAKRGSKTPSKRKSRAPTKKNEPKSVLEQDVGQIFKSLFRGKKG